MGGLIEGFRQRRADREHTKRMAQLRARNQTTQLLKAAMAGMMDSMGTAIKDSSVALTQANEVGRETSLGRSYLTTATREVASVDLFIRTLNGLMDQSPYGAEAKNPERRGPLASLLRRPHRRQGITISPSFA